MRVYGVRRVYSVMYKVYCVGCKEDLGCKEGV